MNIKIPTPTLIRLVQIYRLLNEKEKTGSNLSSTEIGRMLDVPSHTIRKDINYLGEAGNARAGYRIDTLREFIGKKLMLSKPRFACVAGLGKIGGAIIEYDGFWKCGYQIVAGFDSDINLLDTIKTKIEVYPTYRIEEIIKSKMIELAFITVPKEIAADVAEKLVAGEIKGIVSFSKTHLTLKNKDVFVRNIDLVSELSILSAMIAQNKCGTEVK